ncbi:hypothetical protein ES705_27711 [subsurface metagenome]
MAILIDVGAQAINRATSTVSGYTIISKENPVNQAGTLKKVAVFFDTACTGLKIGIFTQVSPDTLTTRSWVEIGSAPAGYSEHDVNLAVEPGDFIGYYCTGGYIDRDNTGEGYWYLQSPQIPCTDQTFTFSASRTQSLFGWTEVPPVHYPRFMITDFQTTPNCEQVTVVIETDVPCHLWLRFTDETPRKHPKTVSRRGLRMGYDIRICFVAYKDLEQEEPGDTPTHTFIITGIPFCSSVYFYFYGTSAGETMVYTSAIFSFFYPFGTPPFKTCEKQEEADANWGFCQQWNAQSQTFTPTHTFKVDMLSLMLNQYDTDTRGPYCVKITRDIPPCWDEPLLAIQYGYSTALPLPGVKAWVSYMEINPVVEYGKTYRIVVHTLPGWEWWNGERWEPREVLAALQWWGKVATNPYPRGMRWLGCDFSRQEGYWHSQATEDYTFILFQRCPSLPS